MKRLVGLVVVIVGAVIVLRGMPHEPRVRITAPVPATTPAAPQALPPSAPVVESDNAGIARAYAAHASDVPVVGSGVVTRVLPDDIQGDRHQRFLVSLPSGQSILIVHNIDIAPRVQSLRVGAPVQFEGEFVWNDKGGLVHWTHHDPAGRHKAGAIMYQGRTYR